MEFTNNTESELTLNQVEGDKTETVVVPAGKTVEQKVYIDFKENLFVKEGLVSIEGEPAKKPGPKPKPEKESGENTDDKTA